MERSNTADGPYHIRTITTSFFIVFAAERFCLRRYNCMEDATESGGGIASSNGNSG